MSVYFRPVVQTDATRPPDARPVAGGWGWFTHAERIERGGQRKLVAALDMPADALDRICAPRAEFAGLSMDRPRLMGVLNITPDSFSDGGRIEGPDAALDRARAMVARRTDFLDVGGESTRPGAREISVAEECARVVPVIKAIRDLGPPVSIDTRKSGVAAAAIEVGARIVNDVSALGFDPDMGGVVAQSGAPVILMHAQGAPATMQDNPRYGDVLLDVYDGLAGAIQRAEAVGIARDRIAIDPGIGFGKTQDHNLTLLRGISIFHDLGCPIVLGASRKRFIGTLTGVERADQRVTGSVAVTQAAIMQGVQIHRVHDIDAMRQALDMVAALTVQRGWHPDQKGREMP